MGSGLLNLLSGDTPDSKILDTLNKSSFDELFCIDLNRDFFKFIYNIEDKYLPPTMEGTYRAFFEYCSDRLVHPDDRAIYRENMDPGEIRDRLALSSTPGMLSFQYRILNRDDAWRWVEQVLVGGPCFENGALPDGQFYCYVYDIQQIKDREAGISRVQPERRVKPDALTGLIRDKDFFQSAETLLSNRMTNWMMIVIDLEQFKLFNEWYGRDAGDRVLARIGEMLGEDAEACDGMAGYMGNDDFCLLMPTGKVNLEDLFARIHGVIVRHGVSVGFLPAFGIGYSNGSVSVLNLFDQASLACHHAKRDFKNRICTFDPSMYRQTAEDYRILSAFQSALKNHEITFWLQPQCRASNGKIVGAESLARWHRADGMKLPPTAFVPVLEKYGFIPDLDKFIWEEVCRWLRQAIDRGLPMIPISVNVSPVDIFTMDVAGHFTALLRRYNLPKSAVKIEITESACSEDSSKVRATVQALRNQGFMVLLDDFGSGYSSLNMLHELSIDMIKLDASFLRMESATEQKSMHILESIVNMAKTIGIPVIMEGVETARQRDYLSSLGCRYVQGFFFYRPMRVEQFEALIRNPDNVECGGFQFKANDEFQIREFLNDTVYSEAMLNNIIGPAAIYSWHGDSVDIVRFNQKFYEVVNLPAFHDRLTDIQRFMPPQDARLMFDLLNKAIEDRLNGSGGVMTFLRGDGDYSRFLIHFYFLNEAGDSRRFYGAARDVTLITRLNHRMELLTRFSSHCLIFLLRRNGHLVFEVAAQGIKGDLMLTRERLQQGLDDGTFFDLVVEEDRETLRQFCEDSATGYQSRTIAFRLSNGRGGWRELFAKSDRVGEADSDVESILAIRDSNE